MSAFSSIVSLLRKILAEQVKANEIATAEAANIKSIAADVKKLLEDPVEGIGVDFKPEAQ